MTNMRVESYTIATSQTLVTTAKRYRSSRRRVHAGTPGWVLVFAHGAGSHKEHFEPLLERLFELDADKNCGNQIVEAWTVDAQTHGAAAKLNEATIDQDTFFCSTFEYASALAALRTSIFLGDADMQRVVLIGANEGAIATLFAPDFFETDQPLPIENFILIDPFTSAPIFEAEEWSSKRDAQVYFSARMDPASAKSFVEHALVATSSGSVKLRASRRHADQLRDKKYTNMDTMVFPPVSGVHLVLTQTIPDLKSRLASQSYASVTQGKPLPDALFHVLTETSHELAERIFGVIRGIDSKL